MTVGIALFASVAVEVPLGTPGFNDAMLAAGEDPRYVGPVTLMQGVGLGLLAFALAALLRTPHERIHDVLGLRPASTALLATAAIGGLLVWIWPSWLAAQLIAWTGFDSSVASIGKLLSGPLSENWTMVLAVAIGAPVSEELLFRGYLWRLVERASGSSIVAFALTTVLFALYHVDPIHVVALLPTAAFLGWLRLRSNSLWPAIIAHFVNNAAAVAIVQFFVEPEVGTGLSWLGLGLFLGVVGAGAWLSRSAVSEAPASPTHR
ncbi:MAG: CPBP family intramembrane glutamic endopeptidase [Myxococcota bacterium]